jgi:cobalt transporter subunit CbtA
MRRILLTALVAGGLGGLFVFALQHARLTPLILAAEVYETGAAEHEHENARGPQQDAPAWQPSNGLERAAYTALADVIVAVGYACLLVGAFVLRGDPVDVPRGMAWGAAGYAVFSLAPAMGLPPELPGSHAADLFARQEWWLATVAATAAGSALVAFSRTVLLKAAGAVVLALPHLIGAPHPQAIGGAVPPELAAEFTAASLATSALFWLVLGALAGGIYARLGRRTGLSASYP